MFFTNAGAANTQQEVYLADRPLPKIVAELESIGRTPKEIPAHLKKILVKLTPELAYEKLGIRWLDNDLRQDYLKDQIEEARKKFGVEKPLDWPIIYPAVVICNMGLEVGYALFAMENIPKGTVIAEYTGSHIKKKLLVEKNPYLLSVAYPNDSDELMNLGWERIAEAARNSQKDETTESIEKRVKNYLQEREAKEAMHFEGNSARFAQPVFDYDALLQYYGYGFFDKTTRDSVLLSNADFVACTNNEDARLILIATRDIKRNEQIGIPYDIMHVHMPFEWRQYPHVFDKKGNIISPDKYQILHKQVTLVDLATAQRIFLYPRSEAELMLLGKKCEALFRKIVYKDKLADKMGIFIDNAVFVVPIPLWEQQISRAGNKIIILGTLHEFDLEERQGKKNFWEGYSKEELPCPDIIVADFSEEPQQMLETKASLKLKSVALAAKYPAFVSFISPLDAIIDEISYTKIMKIEGMEKMRPYLDTLPTVEEKEQAINSVIQGFDEIMKSVQQKVDSLKKSLEPLPEDIVDLAYSSVKLEVDVYALGKQELAAMLIEIKKDSDIKQEL